MRSRSNPSWLRYPEVHARAVFPVAACDGPSAISFDLDGTAVRYRISEDGLRHFYETLHAHFGPSDAQSARSGGAPNDEVST